MPRIPLFPLDHMTPEQQRVYDGVVAGPRKRVVGPLRAALHRPELAERWSALGEILRYNTSLPPRLSELAIIVTARHWSAQLEWQQHAPAALKGGLAPAIVEAIRLGKVPQDMKPDEQAVYEYARELHEAKNVNDATHAKATALLGVTGVVELTALIGYYTMVAMTLNAHDIPLPEGEKPQLPAL
jgi:4-carboxymuconolactone decarboxylase